MRRLLGVLIVVLAGTPLSAQGRSRIDWSAHGWQGFYRLGSTVPVIVQVGHAGPAARLTVELRGAQGLLLARAAFLAADRASRRIEFALPAPQARTRWSLHLLVDDTRVESRTLRWRRLGARQRLVVTLGRPPQTLMPHLGRLEVVYLRPEPQHLPRRWAGWSCVDLCVLRQPDPLASGARRALRRWILAGGRVVACLAGQPERIRDLLGPLLPWRLAGRERVDSGPLMHWLARPRAPKEPLMVVRGRAPPQRLLAGDARAPLVGYQAAGQGGTLTLHFHPTDVPGLASQLGETFWNRILRYGGQRGRLRHVASELLRAAPRAPLAGAFVRTFAAQGGGAHQLGWLIGFTLLYALALGPLAWLGHRRGGIAGLVLVAVASVVVFCGAALLWREHRPRPGPRQLTLRVVDIGHGWQLDRRLSGLYHWREDQTLALRYDSDRDRAWPVRLQWRGFVQETGGGGVAALGGVRRLRGLAPVYFSLQRPTVGSLPWRAEYALSGARVNLHLSQPLDTSVRDAVLVTRTGVYALPELAAGMRLVRSGPRQDRSSWLAGLRQVRRLSLRQALILETFGGPTGSPAPRSVWDLSGTLDRESAVLFARGAPRGPALTFPGLRVSYTQQAFLRVAVQRRRE